MDGSHMESYLSFSTSLSYSPPCLHTVCVSLSRCFSWYCLTLLETQNEQCSAHHFLLTSSSCALTFSDHRQFSLLSLFFRFQTSVQCSSRLKSDLGGQVVIDLPLCSKQQWLPAGGGCRRRPNVTRGALALPDRQADGSCEKELSLTWELAFVNTWSSQCQATNTLGCSIATSSDTQSLN